MLPSLRLPEGLDKVPVRVSDIACRAPCRLTAIWRHVCRSGTLTTIPSRLSSMNIWHARRLPASRRYTNSSSSSSSLDGGSMCSRQAASTWQWQVEHVQPPPHCAKIPGTAWSSATSMMVSFGRDGCVSSCPLGCTKTTLGIFIGSTSAALTRRYVPVLGPTLVTRS
jgi:hypothetical protein